MASDESSEGDYKYRGSPLMPSIIAELAEELFAGQLVKRSDVIERVSKLHAERGGAVSSVDTVMQAKKAYRYLAEAGKVESGGYGRWRFSGQPPGDAVDSPFEDVTDEELAGLIAVERWVGKGDELVYAYSFPAYVALAASAGRDRWPIKIGFSRSVSLGRVAQQVGTGTPEWPTVHLAIRCDDCLVVEKVLHNALKVSGHHIENAPGSEWFQTSPDWVVDFLARLNPGLVCPADPATS